MVPPWETGVQYKVGDQVYYRGIWVCLKDHISNVFGNDVFDKGCWARASAGGLSMIEDWN